MNRKKTMKITLSPQSVATLEALKEAKRREEPFQECLEAGKRIMGNLVTKDLVAESSGVDGTLKYQITGRGTELLEKHLYVIKVKSTTSVMACEGCLHRYVLDQVRGCSPDVDELFVATEALANLKDRLNGGSVQENMTAVRELYAQLQAVEAILGRLS